MGADEKLKLGGHFIMFCKGLYSLNHNGRNRNFSNSAVGDDSIGSKVKQFKSSSWAIIRIQKNAIKGVCCRTVGWLGLMISLDIASKRVGAGVVVVNGFVGDDCLWTVVRRNAALWRDYVEKFHTPFGQCNEHGFRNYIVG